MAFITLIHALCQQTFGLSLPRNCAFLANQQIAVVLLDLESPGGLERATLIQFRPSRPSLWKYPATSTERPWPNFDTLRRFLCEILLRSVRLFIGIQPGK